MRREPARRNFKILLDLGREAIAKSRPSPGRCQLLQVGLVRRLVKTFPGRQLRDLCNADEERACEQANRCGTKQHCCSQTAAVAIGGGRHTSSCAGVKTENDPIAETGGMRNYPEAVRLLNVAGTT